MQGHGVYRIHGGDGRAAWTLEHRSWERYKNFGPLPQNCSPTVKPCGWCSKSVCGCAAWNTAAIAALLQESSRIAVFRLELTSQPGLHSHPSSNQALFLGWWPWLAQLWWILCAPPARGGLSISAFLFVGGGLQPKAEAIRYALQRLQSLSFIAN